MGTMVTGIHYRHPAVLANVIATLDIISAGRLEVGNGRCAPRRVSPSTGNFAGGAPEAFARIG